LKIIFIVAHDLARNVTGQNYGSFTVGPETRIACDRAVEIVNSIVMCDKCSDGVTDVAIVATAGHASTPYGYIYMAQVMKDYLRKRVPENIPILIRRAEKFNTSGEMEALAELIDNLNQRRNNIENITLAVKWWHAPRSWCLCKYWLWQNGLKIPVVNSKCPSRVSWTTIANEFLLAWPKNILRISILGR